MGITVRLAVEDDAPGIAEAHTRAWQVAYEGIVPSDFLAAIDLEQRTQSWRANLAEPELPDGTPSPVNLVAQADETVVGFACVGVDREAPHDPSRGELWAIYVRPDHWGTGAGYALMQATYAQLASASVETATLWVLEDNRQARRFYERQGWRADRATKEEVIGGATITERRYCISFGVGQNPRL